MRSVGGDGCSKQPPDEKDGSSMRGQANFDWTIHEEDVETLDEAYAEKDDHSRRSRTWPVLLGVVALVLLGSYWVGKHLFDRAESNLNVVQAELNEAVMAEQWQAEQRRTEQRLLERAGQRPNANRRAARRSETPPAALMQIVHGKSTALTGSAAISTPQSISPTVFAVTPALESVQHGGSSSSPDATVQDGGVPDVSIEAFELFDEFALVQVYVSEPTAPWHRKPYQVTQTFLESEQGWHLTAPITELWGQRQMLDTNYFHVQYGARDADAVTALVAELDSLYLRLYRELGAVPPPKTRLTIEIDVSGRKLYDVTDLRYSGAKLIVPPPELLPRPEGISLAQALHDAVAFPLAVRVFAEVGDNYIIPCDWTSMNKGIGLWQRWQGHQLPSRRRWEYRQAIGTWIAENGAPALDDLTSVPMDCWQRPPYIIDEPPVRGPDIPRAELASTLVEFAVSRHSYRIVPRILSSFVRHKQWGTLIPDIFDQPADEFEKAWQEYVLREYGPKT